MNRIYRNEIVLFELKQYYRIMKDYTDLFVKDYYGICAYRSSFSSLQVVYEQDLQTAMYDKQSKRLFFLEDLKLQEYVTLSNAESDFEKIAQAYFTNDQKEYIELLLDTQNINEKIAKKAMKYCNRK
ncbi:MAG: hypothetical protein EOM11_04020 [Erysipelotrichia bacterium]|nr:hypothetical protein [Erysipelotrichia bacterium]